MILPVTGCGGDNQLSNYNPPEPTATKVHGERHLYTRCDGPNLVYIWNDNSGDSIFVLPNSPRCP